MSDKSEQPETEQTVQGMFFLLLPRGRKCAIPNLFSETESVSFIEIVIKNASTKAEIPVKVSIFHFQIFHGFFVLSNSNH